ncbi:heme ABC exporter ATP-binding protein CcmA [Phenylobacterium aquaticum]|uniref:heme ABC exporter ATP-binding protein CcmA n=1 Tax=Phenylobacterium aquaticum TaxID=1763816 RepID=UPI001F5D7720|nr:heme ABC exporter ATP-binding protein CcmA [Phenylobacterium aquaticum]MCI3132566.1 heme ABC exporter ATP-binding protein CcmA [Phenylobacterium aquaticum]
MITRLEILDLALARGGRRLFSGLTLNLAAGEACALTGRNGAGKTSLLRAVAGLITPEAGRISFGDTDPADARAQGLHLLGHLDGLKSGRTAREELDFWTRWNGGSGPAAAEAARRLEITPLLDLEIRRLSAGQRRRLALARMLSAPRPLWLLDEPLSPLDSGWRARFGEIMAEHLAGGGLILAAIHDPLPVPAQSVDIRADGVAA